MGVMTHCVDPSAPLCDRLVMPETTSSEKSTAPSSLLADALRNPLHIASRRAELVQAATKLAAEARTRLEGARTDATARVQELRKAGDSFIAGTLERGRTLRSTVSAGLRHLAHDRLVSTAIALQELAKRVEPARAEPEGPAPTAKA